MNRFKLKILSAFLTLFAIFGLSRYWFTAQPVSVDVFNSIYNKPNTGLDKPLKVYHLGHSLVGVDMPVMLEQMAKAGHSHHSQLGWGTYLEQHWNETINGFEESNSHMNFLPAHKAIESGDYDVLILTDAVEIKHAIKYHDSYLYLHKWAEKARKENQDIKVYFYETWHSLNDPEGWLNRIDSDLPNYWEEKILRRALALDDKQKPIFVIPGGQVMARFVRHIEEVGGIGSIKNRYDLFTDDIHFNDYGAYLMALTHYSVIYQRTPIGLPFELIRADGTYANNPGAEVAMVMQKIVWEVVTEYDKTGVMKID